MINKLRMILTRRDKYFLLFLLGFSIFISIIETTGISIIMPFIAVSTNFDLIQSNQHYKYLYDFFSFSSPTDFVIVFGLFLIIFYILRSIINLIYIYFLNRFSQGRYYLIAYRLFENYLGMPYKSFIQKNSAHLTKSIMSETHNLTMLIQNILFMMSEVFIVVFLYSMMLYVNYKMTLLLSIILAVNAILLTKTVSKKIKEAGITHSNVKAEFFKIINKSFGNFKLIKLNGNDDMLLKEFSKSGFIYAQANIKAQTLLHFPRLFLEAIGFGLVVFIITYLVWKYEHDISGLLSIISMFVLALYRLMPSVNRIMTSYNQIMFFQKSLDIVHNDLMYDSENLSEKPINFDENIKLSHITFGYEDSNPILNNISLEIKKGEKIAFVGESGSGKSTLVDLIIGLYKPNTGVIKIDNDELTDSNIKQWRSKIGYIPQSVYLFDGTVAENIVFNRDYDEDKIIMSLKQANIYEFLKEKDGLRTRVGEGGVMLSGGQKQRIAIARALYGEPEILVLDEATSALDMETEEKIMDEIYKASKDKTLIIIAHRLSTINRCEKVYEIKDGQIDLK